MGKEYEAGYKDSEILILRSANSSDNRKRIIGSSKENLMITVNNGSIEIKDKLLIITPNLTKQVFQNSDLYEDVVKEENKSFSIYYVKPQIIGKSKFAMTFFFNETGLIDFININLSNESTISSWESWNKDREMDKQIAHDKWLERNIGKSPYKYNWGEIDSTYDPRSGSSFITVRYYKRKSTLHK